MKWSINNFSFFLPFSCCFIIFNSCFLQEGIGAEKQLIEKSSTTEPEFLLNADNGRDEQLVLSNKGEGRIPLFSSAVKGGDHKNFSIENVWGFTSSESWYLKVLSFLKMNDLMSHRIVSKQMHRIVDKAIYARLSAQTLSYTYDLFQKPWENEALTFLNFVNSLEESNHFPQLEIVLKNYFKNLFTSSKKPFYALPHNIFIKVNSLKISGPGIRKVIEQQDLNDLLAAGIQNLRKISFDQCKFVREEVSAHETIAFESFFNAFPHLQSFKINEDLSYLFNNITMPIFCQSCFISFLKVFKLIGSHFDVHAMGEYFFQYAERFKELEKINFSQSRSVEIISDLIDQKFPSLKRVIFKDDPNNIIYLESEIELTPQQHCQRATEQLNQCQEKAQKRGIKLITFFDLKHGEKRKNSQAA